MSEELRLKRIARSVLRIMAPPLYRAIHHYRNEGRCEKVAREVIRELGCRVRSGPFTGMAYIEKAICSALPPKIIGCYEEELHSSIEEICTNEYAQIIDIGCAEGYYSVGLALRFPNASVVAFDIDEQARSLCAEMCAKNNVDTRVEVRGACTCAELSKVLRCKAMVFCDCEGCELELLNPDTVPELTSADVIVELHEFLSAGVSKMILDRFSLTHDIRLIDATSRDPLLYPAIEFLKRQRDREIALGEMRPSGMQWAVMMSKGDAIE